MKFMESKLAYSRENKEKHEAIIRKMLTDYIPKLDHALFLASNYLSNKTAGITTHSSPIATSERMSSVDKFMMRK